MAGAFLQLEITGLDAALAWLNRIGNPRLGHEGLVMLGGLVENQTKDRIKTEKTTPEGDAWAPWSPAYAKTRHGGQSLLRASGALLTSLAFYDSDDEVQVGSNLVYAAVQQFGDMGSRYTGGQDVKAHKRRPRGSDEGAERTIDVTAHSRDQAIPAREYLGMSDANVAAANKALEEWIEETLP